MIEMEMTKENKDWSVPSGIRIDSSGSSDFSGYIVVSDEALSVGLQNLNNFTHKTHLEIGLYPITNLHVINNNEEKLCFVGINDLTHLDAFSNHANIPKHKNIECIYFLFKENEVVYIGKSIKVISRLKNHWKDKDKDFDSFFILDNLGGETLSNCEKFWIKQFKPKLNKTFIKQN